MKPEISLALTVTILVLLGIPPYLHPQSLDCTDAIHIGCNPAITVSGDTTGKPNNVNSYTGVTWDESGPEDIYTVEPDGIGDIYAILTMLSADLDVFLLDECDETTTLGFGSNTAHVFNADTGTYYIVVDGYDGAEGSYDLTIHMSCSATSTPTPTGTWYTFTRRSGLHGRN